MKRLLFFVAGYLMIACNMTDDVDNQAVSKKLFHATIDDESTRTFVDEKIRLRWTEGDLISLFEGTTRNKQYKFLGETGDNAGDFEDITTGFGSGNDIDRYYAIYPYSSTTKTMCAVISLNCCNTCIAFKVSGIKIGGVTSATSK